MDNQSRHLYEFGGFRLDPVKHVLLCQGRSVPLPPKAFDTLVLLVQGGGRLLRKEELLRTIWADSFVEENNLTQCISVLRKTLGEGPGDSAYIETVPRLGYRFVAEVKRLVEQEPSLLLARHATTRMIVSEEEVEEESTHEDVEGAVKGAASTSISPAGKTSSRRKKLLVAIVVAAVALGAVASVLHFRRAPALTERDQILLADFENNTGEPVFDATLKQALAIKLEESPFLNIVPEQRVRETLSLMGRSADERLTPPVAQEVCQREGVKALVAGSIARLGSHYVIALEATNCMTGESLGREQVDVAGREEVLSALGRASSSLRRKLGEALASIQKLDTPIQEAATPSLEALRAFSLGEAERARGAQVEAIPFYERAIELDPDFALAHGGLAAVYQTIGERDKALQNKKKQFDLRQRASLRERSNISASYYHIVTGEFDKAVAAYEVYEQMYPREFAPHINRAGLYNDAGQFDHALEEGRRAILLNPDHAMAYNNSGWAALRLGRSDEAKKLFDEALARKLDSPMIHRGLFAVAFLEADAGAMQREERLSMGKEGYRVLVFKAQALASSGKLKEARETFQQSAQLARENHLDEAAASVTAGRALTEANFGNYEEAHKQALEALNISHGRDPLGIAASALALSGDTKRAEACIHELAERYPLDTLVNTVVIPAARAAIEIHRDKPAGAVDALRAATPYEFGPFVFGQGYLTGYLRGQAYLRQGDSAPALAEFQRILDHRSAAPFAPLYPLAQLGRARAYAAQGDRESSRAAYESFFSLWKDADRGVPVLLQAQAEYARLK